MHLLKTKEYFKGRVGKTWNYWYSVPLRAEGREEWEDWIFSALCPVPLLPTLTCHGSWLLKTASAFIWAPVHTIQTSAGHRVTGKLLHSPCAICSSHFPFFPQSTCTTANLCVQFIDELILIPTPVLVVNLYSVLTTSLALSSGLYTC